MQEPEVKRRRSEERQGPDVKALVAKIRSLDFIPWTMGSCWRV